jgi:cytoskeletal protein RodZ
MDTTTHGRMQARDAAMRLLNRLTVGVAFSAVAGVGLLGLVSAQTIPGATSTASSASTTSSSTTSSSTSSGSSLGSSSTPVSSSSSSGVAVSGGS